MTPYLMKVQDAELSEEQFCCLLLAERVHSGYEGETGLSRNDIKSFDINSIKYWNWAKMCL